MTESHHDDESFLRRLAAADPVDPATLPTADDQRASALLDGILAGAGREPGAAGPLAPTLDGPGPAGSGPLGDHAVAPAPRPPGRRLLGRGRAALVAVAAAVLVLVGAVAVLAPDNTPAAVAEVHAAAATTASAQSGHVETSFSLDYADGGTGEIGQGTVSGRFIADYDGADLGLSVSLDRLPPELDGDDLAGLPDLGDIRLVDDVVYFQQDGRWLAVDTGGLLGDVVVRYVDPRTVLDTVQTLTETSEVGPAEVDGVAATRYRSVVDLGDDTLAQSGWLAFDGMDVEVDGEVTIDLFVDGDGVLRRFDLNGEVRPGDGQPGRGTFEVVTTFSAIGDDTAIEAPADAAPFDPLAELGRD